MSPVPLCLSLSPSLSLSLSTYLPIYLYRSICIALSICLSLSTYLYVSISIFSFSLFIISSSHPVTFPLGYLHSGDIAEFDADDNPKVLHPHFSSHPVYLRLFILSVLIRHSSRATTSSSLMLILSLLSQTLHSSRFFILVVPLPASFSSSFYF